MPVVLAALCLALFAVSCARTDDLDRDGLTTACPLGIGRGILDGGEDVSGDREVRRLLADPNFGASTEAAGDLRTGVVDPRLVDVLRTVTREHRICVDAFKEGHYFVEGVEDGPRIPDGYGDAGGLPNTHYFGRAADIWYVDGEPVEGNATAPAVLDVGRIVARVPPRERPDQIIGPEAWTQRLGFGYGRGWVLDPDQLPLHDDHIHLGYNQRRGTRNTR